MKDLSIRVIKEKYPQEWREFQKKIKSKEKHSIPSDLFKKTKKEAKDLLKPRKFSFYLGDKHPFIIKGELVWNGIFGERGFISVIDTLQPRTQASKEEKALFHLIKENFEYGEAFYNYVYDIASENIHKSLDYKQFYKEILDFESKVDSLLMKYTFDETALFK